MSIATRSGCFVKFTLTTRRDGLGFPNHIGPLGVQVAGTDAVGRRHLRMDFEKVLIWMFVIGLIGLALTFAWVLVTGG